MDDDNHHGMITRSKDPTKDRSKEPPKTPRRGKDSPIEYEELDEEGNLSDLVVKDPPKKHTRKRGKRPDKSTGNLNDLLMSYLIKRATDKANEELQKRRKTTEKRRDPKRDKDKDKGKDKKKKPKKAIASNEIIVGVGALEKDPMLEESLSDVSDISDDSFHGSDLSSDISSEVSYETLSTHVVKPSRKKHRIIVEEYDDSQTAIEEYPTIEEEEEVEVEEEVEYETEDTDEDYGTEDEDEDEEEDSDAEDSDELEEDEEEEDELEEDDSEEEGAFEYDDYDEKYEELLDKHATLNTEERDMEYYHYLSVDQKKLAMEKTKEIYDIVGTNVPIRFKIIESHMDMKTKAIAMGNIDKLGEMDVSTGEYSKMEHWINGLLKIPFGIYRKLEIGPENTPEEKREYLHKAHQTLDKAIYGHKEAKTHILQVLGKWIQNPESGGNVLAIQGPMGNGKTTLVKEGISKVLGRPFAFIALGGASDSAYFDGHCYTYEGSHWGRIVQILQDSKCMNPVFYFDELDKVSDTQKGEEIIHMLTHLTDASQNSLFQDNYFPGIELDLSKALFIFSYNDESKVNKILKDRMYVIRTQGFQEKDKVKICKEYLSPDIYRVYDFKETDIVLSEDIISYIIATYTEKEEGVRNLKRCIETIISKVNIYALTHMTDSKVEEVKVEGEKRESVDTLSFTIKGFQLPLHVTRDIADILLTRGKGATVPFGMYC